MGSVSNRISDRLMISMIIWKFPLEMIQRAIRVRGRAGIRNRLLGPEIMVYFVLTMCLYPEEGYRAVAHRLADGLDCAGAVCRLALPEIPTTGAVSRARRRLGPEPMQALFAQSSGRYPAPSSVLETRFRRWRVWTLDGHTAGAHEDPAGRRERDPGPVGFQITLLAESGSGWLAGAEVTPATSRAEDEHWHRLFRLLRPGDLVLADACCSKPELWSAAAAAGADLVWRLPARRLSPRPGPRLADGSRLAEFPGAGTVRVLTEPAEDGHQLVTTVLDPVDASGAQLQRVHERRWVFSQAIGPLDALRGGRGVRSRSSPMMEQEIWGHLLIYSMARFPGFTPGESLGHQRSRMRAPGRENLRPGRGATEATG